jgi:hypothetical protein
MDNQPQTTKPISDDQELAEALAGVTKESENLDSEKAPIITQNENSHNELISDTPLTPAVELDPTEPAVVNDAAITNSADLDSIKKDALTELRPLVEKLDLAPEDKFDIYLLMLRSTDDKTLIAPAHLAAQNIADETKRAQALLDVIKEIDFLSAPQSVV